MSRTGILAVLITQLVASQALSAQATDSLSHGADSTKARAQTLKGIDVRASGNGYGGARTRTATKTDTPLRDVPQAATVLTNTFIADKQVQRVAEAMHFVPGITMASGESHQDAAIIRGNSTTADFFVDGVRDDGLLVRDTYNVDRLEAIKGSNAMIFGRGGAGGVINRVTKAAGFSPAANLNVEAGSFCHRRSTIDANESIGSTAALRLNAMAENAGGFRDFASGTRVGVNPTTTLMLGDGTVVRASFEHLLDDRRVDRGVPSAAGAPSNAPITQFFGDPNQSRAHALADEASIVAERALGPVELRNHSHWATYGKFYQNIFPGSAVNAAGTSLNLSAYNHRQRRDNLINQTDLTLNTSAFGMRHTLLGGVELSRQRSTDFRNTGYFNGTATSFTVPFNDPTVAANLTFKPSATDNDNNSYADVGALYVQDQVTLSSWQAVAGVRVERFGIHFHNNRNGSDLTRDDKLVSPRLGLIFKPVEAMSFYGTASVSHLPSSGDQFSSLTVTTQSLEPEHFKNLEVGAKWDPNTHLSLSTALYRLDRTNSQAPDPTTPGRIVQTGARRTTGFEVGATGTVTSKLSVIAGYANQNAYVTENTTAAPAGATVQLVPKHSGSLWGRYQFTDAIGAGAGVIGQSKSFAAIDNTVTLPAFSRTDVALYARPMKNLRAQVNVENVLNARYYPTSQGNNNIVPGAPRTVIFSLTVQQ